MVGDLIDQRLMLGHWRQTRIRRSMDFLGSRRTGRDQTGIDLVVLGPLQVKLRIGAHLRGLEHDDHKSIAAEPSDYGLFIAAARLDADSLDPILPQPGGQFFMTLCRICDLEPGRASIQRCI
jgi:hypothetical protein